MSKTNRGLGLGFIEREIHDKERWEAEKESRINREKLDSEDPLVYVMGPVVYGSRKEGEASVSLYAYG